LAETKGMKHLQKVRFDMWLKCVGLVVQYMDAGRERDKISPPPPLLTTREFLKTKSEWKERKKYLPDINNKISPE
jgi:hypothetical protein